MPAPSGQTPAGPLPASPGPIPGRQQPRPPAPAPPAPAPDPLAKVRAWTTIAVRLTGLVLILFSIGGVAAWAMGLVYLLVGFLQRLSDDVIFSVLSTLIESSPSIARFALGLYLLCGGRWVLARLFRGLHGRCGRCGYDLTGIRGARCPECGARAGV